MGISVAHFFQQNEEQNQDINAMRSVLTGFIKTAKKKHIEIFYTLYKGML